MHKKKELRLQTKTFVLVAVAVLAITFVTLTLIILHSAQEIKEESFGKVREIAYRHSHDVEKELGDTMALARAYAVSLHSILLAGNGNWRISMQRQTQLFAENLPANTVVWAVFDPGTTHLNGGPSGRDSFTPYAYRDKNRMVTGSSGLWKLNRYAAYFRTVKGTRKEMVGKVYRGREASTLMTTFCAPVMDRGRVIGVAGIDFALSDLSERMGKIRPLDEKSYAFMVSNDGIFVAHPWLVYFGHNIAEPKFKSPKATIDAIHQGKEIHEVRTSPITGLTWLVYLVPVKIGQSDAPWSFGLTVPLSTVTAKAQNLIWAGIVQGILSTFVLLIVIFVIARTISRPVQKTIGTLSKAIEQTTEAVCIVGPDGKIQFVNPAWEQITGSSSNDLIGREPLAGRGDTLPAEEIRRALKDNEHWEGTFHGTRKDGTTFVMDITATPLRNDAGAIISYLAMGRDVTQRKQADQALRQSQQEYKNLFENAEPSACSGIGWTDRRFCRSIRRSATCSDTPGRKSWPTPASLNGLIRRSASKPCSCSAGMVRLPITREISSRRTAKTGTASCLRNSICKKATWREA